MPADKSAFCDQSIAVAGDFCSEDDQRACEAPMGAAAALRCSGNKFSIERRCRGASGCKIRDYLVDCDQSLGEPGEACVAPDRQACSADGGAQLTCRRGKFEAMRPCRGDGHCAVAGEDVACDDTRAAAGDPCIMPGRAACSMDGKQELVCQSGRFAPSRVCRRGGCEVKGKSVVCL